MLRRHLTAHSSYSTRTSPSYRVEHEKRLLPHVSYIGSCAFHSSSTRSIVTTRDMFCRLRDEAGFMSSRSKGAVKAGWPEPEGSEGDGLPGAFRSWFRRLVDFPPTAVLSAASASQPLVYAQTGSLNAQGKRAKSKSWNT